MSSLYKQSKGSENNSNQSQPRRSIYLGNSSRSTNHENKQETLTSGNDNSSLQEQKTSRYIKYLKDQNVQLKQQLDKERQVLSSRGDYDVPVSQFNEQLNQIQVQQFQLQLASLQNEFLRYKAQNEDQYKDRLDQIENLLREKQNFMVEKEKLASKNKSLSDRIREFKQINDQLAPEERSSQLKIENEKLKEDRDRIKTQTEKIRSKRDNVRAENEKLLNEINQLKIENKKLKKLNKSDNIQEKQSDQPTSTTRKKTPTRTTEKGESGTEKKAHTSPVVARDSAKIQKKQSTNNKQEIDSKKDISDSSSTKPRSINTEEQNNTSIDKDRIMDLETRIQVLRLQLKDKNDEIDKLRARNSEDKENYDKLRTENNDLTNKRNKYIDETNLCNATIIRQKNNLDDKDKEIDALQMKTSKIKKLIKVVSSIKNTNIILNERNRELQQRLLDVSNPNSNINSNSTSNNQVISFSKMDSLLNDLK